MNRTDSHGTRNVPAGVADDALLLTARLRRCSSVLWAVIVLLVALSLPALPAAGQATITVNTTADNTTADDDNCTLREAIINANNNNDTTSDDCAAGVDATDMIAFDISGGGVQTIQPTSALPTITEGVTIDGYTQPGASANTLAVGTDAVLLIEVDGTNAGVNAEGLVITGSNSTVRGLVINRFDERGIQVSGAGATGNKVQGNYLGTDATGTADLGNSTGVGILTGATDNTIGGTASGARNVISGNGIGVAISTTGNNVQGNYIGTDAAGTAALGNSTGVGIFGATNNTIGGTVAEARNIISGNVVGVEIFGSGTTGTKVQGNYIGTDVNGTAALGNLIGVTISGGATNNTIGGTASGARNVISGSNADGVRIQDSGTTGNKVQGNYIGTDATGTADLGNSGGVVIWMEAANNTIGGTDPAARNVISGNNSAGVGIGGSGATGNLVQGNYIGTDVNGTAALGNSSSGVVISGGASDNTIGGTVAGARNVISGNNSDGVRIDGSGTTGNVVAGNYIGTDVNGTADLGNTFDGVLISDGASNNTIGGTTAGARNVISGNNCGVVILSTGTTGNQVQGNYIGTDVTGTADLGNSNEGVWITSGATGNTIGGTTAGAGNVISGNDLFGVRITRSGTTGNTVEGNYIGTDVTGTADLGNSFEGVRIEFSASSNTIGGTATGARNVISGNNRHGVLIIGTTGNQVQGNYIGTDVNGTADLGNSGNGVNFWLGASNNTIGGTVAGATNTIAFNGENGVALRSDAGTGNAIQRNSLFENTQLGIDLGDDGVTANDPGDGDGSPNKLQNFPAITSAAIDGSGDLILTYLVDTDPANATYDLTVEFFEADIDDEEGQTFLDSNTYSTTDYNGCGTAPCTKTINLGNAVSLGVPPGDKLVATATDAAGNTSEFSAPFVTGTVTRYVATTGNDTANDCTNPLNKCATLAHAVSQANAGDTIDLEAGTYNEPGLVIDKALTIQGQGVVVQ